MSKTNVQKFCNLGTYLEQRSSAFYELVFKKLCLGSALKPMRDEKVSGAASGMTFLFPDKAYIQSFVKQAASSSPEKTVQMLNALIIDQRIEGLEQFPKTVRNRNMEEFEVVHESPKSISMGGHKVTLPAGPDMFVFWHPNTRMQQRIYVYDIKVNGSELRPHSPSSGASNKSASSKKGGGGSYADAYRSAYQGAAADMDEEDDGAAGMPGTPMKPTSSDLGKCKHAFLRKIYRIYLSGSPKRCNIFVKKAFLQMKMLRAHADGALVANGTLLAHLGNDEITDAFLLDKITPLSLFQELYVMFDPESEMEYPEAIGGITWTKYQELKNQVIAESPVDAKERAITAADQEAILKRIKSPLQIMSELAAIYGSNAFAYGRDAFIVFANLCKEMWIRELTEKRGTSETFDSFVCIAQELKPDLATFHKSENLSIEYICSIYGTLLKSDVLCFVPMPTVKGQVVVPDPKYQSVSEIPSPAFLRLFSLNEYASKMSRQAHGVAGGVHTLTADDYLRKYMD